MRVSSVTPLHEGVALYHDTAARYMFPDLWDQPESKSAPDVTAVLAPDYLRNMFFELKPISHASASFLADTGQEQLERYERLLHRKSYFIGRSELLLPNKTDIGAVSGGLFTYNVMIEPAKDVTFIGGQKYYTRGLVYYWLRPNFRMWEAIGVPAMDSSAVEMQRVSSAAIAAAAATRNIARGRIVIQKANLARMNSIRARMTLRL
jgi:hypothetical protein